MVCLFKAVFVTGKAKHLHTFRTFAQDFEGMQPFSHITPFAPELLASWQHTNKRMIPLKYI